MIMDRPPSLPIVLNPNVGVAPGTTTMTLGATRYMPYAEVERLRGLDGLGTIAPPRWGLILFAGLGIFAAVLGYQRWRRKA
jgi:hypothetical protein